MPAGPLPASTDKIVIARSLDEPAVFGALYERHATRIHAYAARRTDAATADDVMAETFLVAFARRRSFRTGPDDSDDAAPWLFGIATNLLHRHRRSEARALRAMARTAQLETVEHTAADGTAEAGVRLDQRAALRDVAEVLRRLPDGQRDVVLLHAWAGLGYEQVAQALDVPLGTVRSRLSRARGALRRLAAPTTLDLLDGDSHG